MLVSAGREGSGADPPAGPKHHAASSPLAEPQQVPAPRVAKTCLSVGIAIS